MIKGGQWWRTSGFSGGSASTLAMSDKEKREVAKKKKILGFSPPEEKK